MSCVRIAVVLALMANAGFTVLAQAVKPAPEEMARAQNWIKTNVGPEATALPFSFSYDGTKRGAQSSKDLLKEWQTKRSSCKLDECRTQTTIAYLHPKTGLEVRCVVIEYNDYPTVEWTVFFKNCSAQDTPFLDDIQGLDIGIDRGQSSEFLLHHNVGSPANVSDYAPQETPLPIQTWKRISIKGHIAGGRPTDSDWPYYNLEWGQQGMIIVVGWPGQWAAQFKRDERTGLRVSAGQEWTHLKLHPGEEIRTPLVVLQFWEGDWIRAQNLWRRWMIKHNLPRPGGKLPTPLYSAASCAYTSWMYKATEENQKEFIDLFLEKGIKLDAWWMDTGWYNKIWGPDKERFPNGIRPISDHAHAKGVKTILWFEPERVVPPGWLSDERPSWCLSASTHPHRLLNLGNPEALEWLNNRIHQVLTEEGIDVYRVDFNMGPLNHWRHNDDKDRQGILENHWVQGFLAHWDEMRRRNPDLLIDTCASGGKRNDMETLRRSVPLWRSDRAFDPLSMQCHTYGISFWIPYNGHAASKVDPYNFRSCMFSAIHSHLDPRKKDTDYEHYRRLFEQWRQVAPNFMGDYYPLTSYSTADDVWMAWQFDRPELGEGVVQAFRRPGNHQSSQQFKLCGLDPEAQYEWINFDVPEKVHMTGRQLAEKGLPVNIPDQPGAVVIAYKKVK